MINIAYGATGPTSKLNEMVIQFFPFILVIVALWFFILRPQTKKYKEHQKLISELKKGDKVITQSGIIGKIIKINEESIILEVSENNHIEFLKSTISSLYQPINKPQVQQKNNQLKK